jgi:hypothetical protein
MEFVPATRMQLKIVSMVVEVDRMSRFARGADPFTLNGAGYWLHCELISKISQGEECLLVVCVYHRILQQSFSSYTLSPILLFRRDAYIVPL